MNKNIKQPITKGVCKVPVIMQLEMLECGAACLTMVLAYYEKWIPLEQVRSDCGVSRDGSNAKNVLKAARSYGLEAKGYRYELEAIKENATFPCIIHWDFNHFVVLKGFRGNYAYLNDPARGEVKVTMDQFDKAFTGIVIQFKPSDSFVPSGKPKGIWGFVKSRSKGIGTAVVFTVLTTIISNLLGIINPGFTRVFYDRLLTGQNLNWANGFIIGMSILALIQISVNIVQTCYFQKINGKLSAVGSSDFMWKVLTLPMEYFSQRMVGDIISRVDSNASIANTLVNTFAPLFFNVVMMVFYFVVMIRNSVLLTVIGLFSLLVNALVSRIVSSKRMNMTRVAMKDSGKLSSTTIAGVKMIETIKASGSENGFFEKWAGYQANVINGDYAINHMSKYFNLIPTLVSSLASLTVNGIGIYLTMQGKFTLGAITAFEGYLSSFFSPAMTLISTSQTIQEMKTQMERIEDVMEYPSDPALSFDIYDENASYKKLSGHIELKDVTFGYSKLDEPLIKNFNLEIKPGEKIALVGSSGCGKSTLAKLICGLNLPWSGEILYDGKKINEIDRSVFTGSIAVVDQDIIIFEDTIANNIKMWDDSIEDFEVILAARDAQIHEDIIQRPDGYNHVLTEEGKDFSGGQRQRFEIARVLAQDPTICILDEATSALDAKTENEVVKAINDRGITCIVVAHRLSTIRDCDQIIVLNHGVVVEQGTHDELIKLDGYYKQLVTND